MNKVQLFALCLHDPCELVPPAKQAHGTFSRMFMTSRFSLKRQSTVSELKLLGHSYYADRFHVSDTYK